MTPELMQLLVIPACFVLAGAVGLRVGTPASLAAALVWLGVAHLSAIGLSMLALSWSEGHFRAWLHVSSQAFFCLGFACLLWISARFPRGGAIAPLGWWTGAASISFPVLGGFAGASPTVVGGDRELGPVAEVLPAQLASLAVLPLMAWPVAAVLVFTIRFWRADSGTRAIMAWPVVGVGAIGLLAVAGFALGQRFPAAGGVAFVLSAPIVPFSVAFGPVRRRLLALTNHTSRLEKDLAARIEELAESRKRLSVAAERERLRIERDLHDGAQQELLALIAQAERARVTPDDSVREQALSSVADLARGAYTTVRGVAHGLRPAALDDMGIVAAARSVTGSLPLDVVVEVRGDDRRRFAPEVEGAALFFVSEAVANVLRHAAATRVHLELDVASALLITICDDGVGGVDPRGGGVRGVCDRVEAVGGLVTIESRPGRTCLEARFEDVTP